ncbi:hypothetical protein HZS_979 [Henneguya salminicola]|nr:hypothetical protein HZS_979 [Henneguya salminicola]
MICNIGAAKRVVIILEINPIYYPPSLIQCVAWKRVTGQGLALMRCNIFPSIDATFCYVAHPFFQYVIVIIHDHKANKFFPYVHSPLNRKVISFLKPATLINSFIQTSMDALINHSEF